MNANVNEKNIFRLAALVYGNAVDNKHTEDTLLAIIESSFIDNQNQPMQKNQLISSVLKNYSVIITEEELNKIILRNSSVFCVEKREGTDFVSIDDALLIDLQEKTSKSIDFYIDMYIKESGCDVSAKEIIYRFLYNLTTTNITSYQKMLGNGVGIDIHSESAITVDSVLFSDAEREVISEFMSWENPEKDAGITNLILCCLEYCVVVSGDHANELTKKHLKKRHVYLDTNILFRALGINGTHRQEVTTAFLSKCKQAGIQLIITSYTLREFWDTMKYYIQQAIKLPADNIYDGAYEELCEYNVFSYYHAWKRDHLSLPHNMFWSYLKSAVKTIIDEYAIEEDARNIFAPDVQKKIDAYDQEIRHIKEEDPYYVQQYYGANKHDAIMVYIAEQKRIEVCAVDTKADCMIATSDKQLRFWDYARSKSSIPLVVYPSQLFALLIKLCGRSTNDMKSFVSFINIKPAIKQISVGKANAILAAIGSLTNDFKTQKLLVASVFDDEFQRVIASAKDEEELFEMSKIHGQKLIDQKMEQQDTRIYAAEQKVAELTDKLAHEERLRDEERTEYDKAKSEASDRSNRQSEIIEKMALQHTWLPYHCVWTFLPIVAFLVGGVVLLLLAIGLFGSSENNITLQLIEWYKTTPLGSGMSDPYGWLVPASIAVILGTWGYGFRMLFTTKRRAKRIEYKKNYLDKMQA